MPWSAKMKIRLGTTLPFLNLERFCLDGFDLYSPILPDDGYGLFMYLNTHLKIMIVLLQLSWL